MKPLIPYSAEERTVSLPRGVDFRDPNQREPWEPKDDPAIDFGLAALRSLGSGLLAQQQAAVMNDLFSHGIGISRISPNEFRKNA